MTADTIMYNISSHEPHPSPMVNVDEDADVDMTDFEPLPLDASLSGDLGFFNDVFLLLNNDNNNQNTEDPFVSLGHSSSNYNNNKTLKHRRRVSFQDHPTEISVPSFANLAEEERRDLWYRQVDIERFRSVARHACRRLRKDPDAYPSDITRGLELRTSLDRQYRKHLARSCILKSQALYPHIDPLQLAAIADRCTESPRQEALAQGTRDFCEVYHTNTMGNNNTCFCTTNSPLSIPSSENVESPFRRCLGSNSDNNKRLPSMILYESFDDTSVPKRRRCFSRNVFSCPIIEQTT